MKNDIIEILNKYLTDEISLKRLEDIILEIMEFNASELLNDILEDISYTKLDYLSSKDKEYGLMSDFELKSKLKQYLKSLD